MRNNVSEIVGDRVYSRDKIATDKETLASLRKGVLLGDDAVGEDGGDFISEDSEIEGVMEVSLTDINGTEYVYWVDLSKLPEDEDEYDWSIEITHKFHAKTIGTKIAEDDEESVFASEPFTRIEGEFVWVNKD